MQVICKLQVKRNSKSNVILRSLSRTHCRKKEKMLGTFVHFSQ